MNARTDIRLLDSVLLPESSEKEVLGKLEELLGRELAPKREAYISSKIYPGTMGHPGTTQSTSLTRPTKPTTTPKPN